jgi:hypothetical protein
MMGAKQIKLKPVQPIDTENFAGLMRKFGARPIEEDSMSDTASNGISHLTPETLLENRPPENRTPLENRTPENRTPPENRVLENRTPPENRASENDSAYLVRSIGFTAFGVLSSLRDYFLQGNEILNILQFAKLHGISRSALSIQLRILEQNGLIQLGPPERRGRSLKISCFENGVWCPENRTLHENHLSSSSSYYNKLLLPNKKLYEDRAHENRAPENRLLENSPPENRAPENRLLENRTYTELALTAPVSENVHLEDGNEDKLPYLPSWEKAQMRDQAEELFYIGLTAKTEPEMFSMQTLILYSRIVKERGKDWAAALFLILLPKAKDNPTGYISSAYRNGAEPTSASILQVKDMWAPLETIGKSSTPQSLKDCIREAVEKEDLETIASLTQMQTLTKAALRILSWTATQDELLKRRNVFIDSLFS